MRSFTDHLRTLVFFVLTTLSHHVLASNPLIIEQSFYEDNSSVLSFSQVKTKKFSKFDGVLSKGYTDSALWVRLKLDSTKLQNQQKVAIKVLPAFLDEIKLFSENDDLEKMVVGDRYPQKNNAVTALNFNFVNTFNPEQPYVWLRLKTTSSSLMSVEAMTIDEFNQSSFAEHLLGSLTVGIFCCFALMGLVYFLQAPELVNGTFLVKQLINLFLAFMYFGYGHIFLSDIIQSTTVDYLTSFTLLLYSLATSAFYWAFYKEYQLRKWVTVFFTLFMSLLVLEIFISYFGYMRATLSLNIKLNAIACIFNFLLIPLWGVDWAKETQPLMSKRKIILIQSLTFIIYGFSFLPHFSLYQASKVSTYLFMLNAFFSSLLIFILIRHRAIKLDQNRLIEVAIKETQYEQEKLRREKQEQFMAMLTHELKTPLSLIRFAVRTAFGKSKVTTQIDQAVDDINAVIERCELANKLDMGWQFNKEKKNIKTIMAKCLERHDCENRISLSPMPDEDVLIDVSFFNIMIGNLIENALKYSPKEELIYIELITSKSQNNLCIIIKNKVGRVGLPDKNRVFEKYYRSEYAHEVTGSGLGLYIVKSLVELLGGNVEYTYEDGFVVFKLCLNQ